MIMMPMVMLMSNVLLCWLVLFGLGLLICGVVVSVYSRRFSRMLLLCFCSLCTSCDTSCWSKIIVKFQYRSLVWKQR
ncbi:hypothetical protein BJX66DRAFT_216199 [Aspergillus keveii]|uniref:Uncharacterized protein n=1 Tax=Aspergillus keveii TaxID=714993 RepID=A0ABR4G4R8_9EURO